MKALYKHTIVIWSESDEVTHGIGKITVAEEMVDWAHEAIGGVYCTTAKTEKVEDPVSDLEFDEGLLDYFDDEEEA